MKDRPRILVVDDDESTCRTLSLIFGKQGYEAETVGTGQAAIEKAQARFFNLALLDIRLPDMEGIELLAPLKERHPDIAVIMVTGYASVETAVRALNEGASAYITKPLNMAEVLSTVRQVVEKQHLIWEKRRAEEALRNALDEAQRRQAEVSALLQTSRAILELDEFEAMARFTFDRCKDLTGATVGYVALVGESEAQADVVFLDMDGQTCTVDPLLPMPIRGLRAEVYRDGRARYDNDFAESEWAGLLPEGHIKLSNVLLAPLMIDGDPVGVLGLGNKPGDFSEDDARMATAFGELAAIALRNNRTLTMLEESEERFRRLAENAQDIIYRYRLSPSPGFEYVSPAATEITGYTPEEHYADPELGFKLVHPEDRHLLEAVVRGAGSWEEALALRWLRKDRTVIWTEQRNVPVYDKGGELVAIEGIARDITERVQRQRELEALVTIAMALRETSSGDKMFPIILEQLLDLLDVQGAAIAMRDPRTGETVIELGHGQWAEWTGAHLPPGQGVSGYVIETGERYVNNDVLDDQRLARPELVGDLCAVACAPLLLDDKGIGALWVGCDGVVADQQVSLLTTVSEMAANAIRRAMLHEQTEQRLQRLTALRNIDTTITASLDLRVTLNIILDQATTRLNVDAADVLLLNPHTQLLEYVTGRGFRTAALQHTHLRLGEGYAGRAALERCIVSVPNLAATENSLKRSLLLAKEDFVTYYAVPLVAKGQVEGVLEIFHREPFDPDQEWLDFLEALATQTAIAINNAELFDNLQRSNAELTLAYDTTLEGWARALELRDIETEGHSRRVTDMTVRLAREMGIGQAELAHVRRGALLHDIGKMGVSVAIDLTWRGHSLWPSATQWPISPPASRPGWGPTLSGGWPIGRFGKMVVPSSPWVPCWTIRCGGRPSRTFAESMTSFRRGRQTLRPMLRHGKSGIAR